ncbi:MAG: bifunctional riboflavin kinase/FAD synthetase [Clostridia bacterium]|nr:bifunctional riboflavin kinase/FAD synthetase [Clostridia bacterium]
MFFKKEKVKVYNGIQAIDPIHKPVVTVGTFDGLHIGHQKVIGELVHTASTIGGKSVVVTFYPHPRTVLQPNYDLRLIISRKEKMKIFEKLGVDVLICLEFTKEFAKTSSEDFIKKYLVEPLHPIKVIIGYDHHFGADRKGNLEFLTEMGKKYDFEVEKVAMQELDETAVSSSKIREAIRRGDMKAATKFLGYNFSISGKVVMGNQLGRKLGFPTANIQPDEPNKIIPEYGVYAILLEWNDKLYKGMSNIGIRPTLKENKLTIEAHLFDFDEDLYGQEVTLYFLDHTRVEKKFRDVELLRRRLIIDRLKVKKILGDDTESTTPEANSDEETTGSQE